MLEQLTIFEKAYQLVLWLYPTVAKFPKSQRFVLGQQIENAALDIVRGIIRANASRSKLPLLHEISVDLDTLLGPAFVRASIIRTFMVTALTL